MPMQSGEISIAAAPHSSVQFEEGTEFTFTTTPGSDWYGEGIVPGYGMVTGEQGAPLVVTTSVLKTATQGGFKLYLRPVFGAAESLPPGDESPMIVIEIVKQI